MKTVKRKAEVGEKILSKRDNMVHEVLWRDWFGVGTSEKSTVPHDDYEVIIEDEPKLRPGTGTNTVRCIMPHPFCDVGSEYDVLSHCGVNGEIKAVRIGSVSHNIVVEGDDLKRFEWVEDDQKVIKSDHGTFVVKDEESNAYISAVDVEDGNELLASLFADEVEVGAIPPHSSHYHQNGLDPLEVMRRTFPPEQYEGFLRGSLLKYAMRYDRKGQQQEDLEKLNFYGRELEEWKNALKDVDGKVIEAEGAE